MLNLFEDIDVMQNEGTNACNEMLEGTDDSDQLPFSAYVN